MLGKDSVTLRSEAVVAAGSHFPFRSLSKPAVASRTWAKHGGRDGGTVFHVQWLEKVCLQARMLKCRCRVYGDCI